MQTWFLFNVICKAACSINNNIAEVYLTNDLGFPKENLSIIKVICTPLNIMFALVSGYLSSSQPFVYQSYNLIALVCISTYSILVLLATFPSQDETTQATYFHVTAVLFFVDLIQNFEFVTAFAIMMKVTDKRISGIHITVLAAMYNFGEFIHKFYIFRVVDIFGIFYPQVILATIAIAVWVKFRSKFIGLEACSLSSWHITDSVL